MKTLVELYEDNEVSNVVSRYARINYLKYEDLKQEVFLGILSEYDSNFDIENYIKKIAMRMKRAEMKQHLNEMPFDEKLDTLYNHKQSFGSIGDEDDRASVLWEDNNLVG